MTTTEAGTHQPDETGSGAARDEIGELLRFDPIRTAEYLTGDDLRGDDDAATLFALGLASAHGEAKVRALKATRDTYFSMPFAEHLAVFTDLGFDIVLEDAFTGSAAQQERFVVLWHPDGILGACESYTSVKSTNKSGIVYAWRPDEARDTRWPGSSGCWNNGAWYGDHDTREGLRHTIGRLRASGSFRPLWAGQPTCWFKWKYLATYMETKPEAGYARWDEPHIARYRRLPEALQTAMDQP